jgi:RNA polymerase sigma factor for flagellar operon FliA
MQAGGQVAEARTVLDRRTTMLIEEQLPLVKHIVFQVAVHFPRHVDRDDLARAGALGLIEAARRWDEDRGVPFDRFAARRIKGAILDAVRAADWAPRSVRVVARRLEQAEQRLTAELGRMPSSGEVADALGMPAEELARLSDRVYRSVVLALEHPVAGENDEVVRLADMLCDTLTPAPDEQLEDRELLGYLHDAVNLLPERHRLVIVGYFLEARTSVELATFLGVTESRISQIRSEALEMLRSGIEAQYDGATLTVAPPDASRRRIGVRLAERGDEYADAIRRASEWQSRLTRRPQIVAPAPTADALVATPALG